MRYSHIINAFSVLFSEVFELAKINGHKSVADIFPYGRHTTFAILISNHMHMRKDKDVRKKKFITS